MDDQEALLARRVARAASAWLKAPSSVDVYRRLVDAVAGYDAHIAPRLPFDDLDGSETELLDELVDQEPPAPLSQVLEGLPEALRAQARRRL